jgi:site-specific DNA-methyltransferase (cytosine-N4-specific)
MARHLNDIKLTRHSSIHPYPAMIADDLAIELACQFVNKRSRVFDPFAGTGRTLVAAASRGGSCVGLDVNPLAVLIAQAKISQLTRRLGELIELSLPFRTKAPKQLDFQPGRKVSWFSESAQKELAQIVTWVNSETLSRNDLILLGVVLSATVREVSFCRKDQWKLHRLSSRRRELHDPSAWAVFERRLKRALQEDENATAIPGSVRFCLGDTTKHGDVLRCTQGESFNLVITSPPYGDSRSTVSYGGVSSLCLGVLQHIPALRLPFIGSNSLDAKCLGGNSRKDCLEIDDLKRYWAGGAFNPARERVVRFLVDLEQSCAQTVAFLERKSRTVFVVSRRKVGGRRLYLDRFLESRMATLGFELEEMRTRALFGKSTPYVINSRARSGESVLTRTMREELILSFSRS